MPTLESPKKEILVKRWFFFSDNGARERGSTAFQTP